MCLEKYKLKIKKKTTDKMPTDATTPSIMYSGKLLVRTTGTGASLGKEPPRTHSYSNLDYVFR